MLQMLRYWLWLKKANKAVASGLTTKCCLCGEPIVPGDSVAIVLDNKKQPAICHAGFHFSLSRPDAFCVTDAIGIGVWDGHQVAGQHEMLAERALRTGRPQVG